MKQATLSQIKWLLSKRHTFNFDGKPEEDVVFNPEGKSGFQLFYEVDTYGKKKVEPTTRHPNIYRALMKTKSSVNLHIKMYSEDFRKKILLEDDFMVICSDIGAPEWFIKAVKNQRA
jgi:hypothetical protein